MGIVTFYVVASSGTTMSYQWYKDGAPISGATSSSYTILSVLGSSAGNYYVKVTNAGGSVLSNNATLNVTAPPVVMTQPQSQTVVQGQNASFSVVASGTGPLVYQWYFNGVSLGTAGTNATLTLLGVGTNRAGGYYVVMSNFLGSAMSSVAALTVLVPAGIATPPQAQAVYRGQSALFSVVASGTAPFRYQWSFNGVLLSGATTSTLILTNVQTTQAGGYSVSVTNTAGFAASPAAPLAVTIPTIDIFVPPGTGMGPNGFTFQVSVPAGSTYIVEATEDFRAWTPIGTNVAGSPSAMFTDSAASNHRHRFYRAVAP